MSKYTYKTGGYVKLIERFEVVKETDKQITILKHDHMGDLTEKREAKRSRHTNYFDTFAEAKAFLMDDCDSRIRDYQSRMDSVKARKQRVNELNEENQ